MTRLPTLGIAGWLSPAIEDDVKICGASAKHRWKKGTVDGKKDKEALGQLGQRIGFWWNWWSW